MPPALKEWAVVCRALLEGDQVVILRKGGISEEGRKFSVPHPRFWLYPTYEHQDPDLVKAAYRPALADEVAHAPSDGTIRVAGWAEVTEIRRTFEPDELSALDGNHIWAHHYAESRLRWKKREALWVLALRAHRLDKPFSIPFDEAYAGCSSWVEFPEDVAPPEGGTPALSDVTFAVRCKGVLGKLPTPASE